MNHSTEMPLTIGQLAEKTGCNVPTIRYYEEIGLLPPAQRRASGHRVYESDAQELLTFIRHCREFGFPIEHVRALISLSNSDDRDCVETRSIAQQHLESVRTKLTELKALERSLATFVDSCSSTCAGGPAPKCTILKDIGTPAPVPAKPPGCCS